MSAESVDEQSIAQVRATAEPLYFESGAARLFGWLHASSGDARATLGIAICKPFGFEAMSAHLSMHAFAETAAAGSDRFAIRLGGRGRF